MDGRFFGKFYRSTSGCRLERSTLKDFHLNSVEHKYLYIEFE